VYETFEIRLLYSVIHANVYRKSVLIDDFTFATDYQNNMS